MGLRYPGLRQERRGIFTGPCCRPLGAGDAAFHPVGREEIAGTLSPGPVARWQLVRAKARLGAWHTTRCRTATPPALSLPGPFVTGRRRPALAAYLSARKVRARSSGRARTRPGKIRDRKSV